MKVAALIEKSAVSSNHLLRPIVANIAIWRSMLREPCPSRRKYMDGFVAWLLCSSSWRLTRKLGSSLVTVFLCLLTACATGTATGTPSNTSQGANTPTRASTPTLPPVANHDACSLVTANQASQTLQVKASAAPTPVKPIEGATATSACTYQDNPITASATLQVIYYQDSTTAKTKFEAGKHRPTLKNVRDVSGVGASAFSAGESPVLAVLRGKAILLIGVTSVSAQHLLDQEIGIAKDAVATLG